MSAIRRNVCFFIVIGAVIWSVNSSMLPLFMDTHQRVNRDYNEWGFRPLKRESRQQSYHLLPEGYEQQFVDPQLFQQERVARQQKTRACQWLGCRNLPLGKGTLCPTGTFLESYMICSKGSKKVDVQCCP